MTFTIIAAPSTDIWRKPPTTNVFNASTFNTVRGLLTDFQRARITVVLPPTSDLVKYDQGGIVLSIIKHSIPGASLQTQRQWLKTGIEFYQNKPWVGTVACDRWADWSITPLPDTKEGDNPRVNIEVERSSDELGKSLWVYLVSDSGERTPLREVNFFFADEDSEKMELNVSAYAARPLKKEGNETEELKVQVTDYTVDFRY